MANPVNAFYPASNVFSVTPSDSADFTRPTTAIMANVAGDISVVTVGGDTATLTVLAGVMYPIRCVRVNSTGTTATGITGFY